MTLNNAQAAPNVAQIPRSHPCPLCGEEQMWLWYDPSGEKCSAQCKSSACKGMWSAESGLKQVAQFEQIWGVLNVDSE